MFGKYTFVEKKPKKLFEENFFKINKKKIIGIFDIDIKDNVNRTRISKKFQDIFYNDIIKIINKFPEIQFVFKPKKVL